MSTGEADLVWIMLHVEAFGGEADDYVSVPRAEWAAMTEAEQEGWCVEAAEEHIANHASGGGWVVDESEVPANERDR